MAGEILDNSEAIEAWDGPLFERFVQFRATVTEGLGAHGERALALHPPQPGERVLDIGCGFGDTADRIAGLVGPAGAVLGVDAAPRFIESARAEYGAPNVRFEVADVEQTRFEQEFDLAFSRFGTMFFANPVHALRATHARIARKRQLDSGVCPLSPESDSERHLGQTQMSHCPPSERRAVQRGFAAETIQVEAGATTEPSGRMNSCRPALSAASTFGSSCAARSPSRRMTSPAGPSAVTRAIASSRSLPMRIGMSQRLSATSS